MFFLTKHTLLIKECCLNMNVGVYKLYFLIYMCGIYCMYGLYIYIYIYIYIHIYIYIYIYIYIQKII